MISLKKVSFENISNRKTNFALLLLFLLLHMNHQRRTVAVAVNFSAIWKASMPISTEKLVMIPFDWHVYLSTSFIHITSQVSVETGGICCCAEPSHHHHHYHHHHHHCRHHHHHHHQDKWINIYFWLYARTGLIKMGEQSPPNNKQRGYHQPHLALTGY